MMHSLKSYKKYKLKYSYDGQKGGKKPDEAELRRIIHLYLAFYKKQILNYEMVVSPALKNTYSYLITGIEHTISQIIIGNLSNLNIGLPIEEIELIFAKYGIIVLRMPDSNSMLVGCGNEPQKGDFADPAKDDPDHKHIGLVTLNVEISFNPTIIAAFGFDSGLNRFYEEYRCPKIEYLYSEAASIVMNVEENEKAYLREMIKSNISEILDPNFGIGELEPNRTPKEVIMQNGYPWLFKSNLIPL